jgi:AbiU2
MKIDDPTITKLRAMVTAAFEELDWAVRFYEVWKIAAHDKDLHARMGTSYSTHAFMIARAALQREMLLALMRLWDKSAKAIQMHWIESTLRRSAVIDTLALDRSKRFGLDVFDAMRADLQKKADEAIALIQTYRAGPNKSALEKLIKLRHHRLAHRQVTSAAPEAPPDEREIEDFYRANTRLIEILASLVNAMGYSVEDGAGVYRHYAKFFWAGTRGEQTKGHPNYRKPPGSGKGPPQKLSRNVERPIKSAVRKAEGARAARRAKREAPRPSKS